MSPIKIAESFLGQEVIRLINELKGLDKKGIDKNSLVYRLGGGTFDVALVTIHKGVFKVVATSGDTHLGGEDFDERVMEHFIKIIKEKSGKDLKDEKGLQRLRKEIERGKCLLLITDEVELEIKNLIEGFNFSEVLTRAKFEEITNELFEKILDFVRNVLEDSNMNKTDIHEIVLVGGLTRIPKIQQLIKDFFDIEPNRGVKSDEAVAFGAAVQASIVSCETSDTDVVDVVPLTLGSEAVDKETGKSEKITITEDKRSQDDIERRRDEVEEHEEEDHKQKEKIAEDIEGYQHSIKQITEDKEGQNAGKLDEECKTTLIDSVWDGESFHPNAVTDIQGPVIGIDLGTTYSCVGIYKDGRVEIIARIPSYVAFDDKKCLVGEAAKNQPTENPTQTLFNVKRLIGCSYSDPSVQSDKELLPFTIIKKNNKPFVRVKVGKQTKTFPPEKVCGLVLKKMKEIAESFLGQEVKNAVVSVPAYFNAAQRQATKDAGAIAGLNVIRIINETTAAAIAYGLNKKGIDKNILVYHLGGGTCDVSVLTIQEGVLKVFATSGDAHLGGEDFDERVMKHFIKIIKEKSGKDLKDKKGLEKLRKEVERGKRVLSIKDEVKLEIKNFIKRFDFFEVLTRAEFEEINNDLFEKTLYFVKNVLEACNMNKTDIDEIVFVGGSTRIPKIQQLIKDFFNGKEPNRGVKPDEAVAFGAAVQAAILAGETMDTDVILKDVVPFVPLSLGMESAGGIMLPMINRNSVIPTKQSKVFTTTRDNQTSITIKVYEGERLMTKDNHFLGELRFTGIRSAPRGVASILETFKVDADGNLKVSAVDKETRKSAKITITKDKRLSQDDIERMIDEAEKHAEEDHKQKKENAAKNFDKYLNYIKQVIEDKEGKNPEQLDWESKTILIEKLDEKSKTILSDAFKEGESWLELNPNADADDIQDKRIQIQLICNRILANLS